MTPRFDTWGARLADCENENRRLRDRLAALEEALERVTEHMEIMDRQAADGGGLRGVVQVTAQTWREVIQPEIREARAALAGTPKRVSAALSTANHKLVRAAPDGVACICGQYDDADHGVEAAELWRGHLIQLLFPRSPGPPLRLVRNDAAHVVGT